MAETAIAAWEALQREVALARCEPRPSRNPCIALYGPGPEGLRCGACRQMYAREGARRYWKCRLRKDTGGQATDHRLRWPACARFEARGEAFPEPTRREPAP